MSAERFETQPNHEIKSLKLSELVRNADKLAHLASVPVVLANYRVQQAWIIGANKISQRLPDLEPCAPGETLGIHIRISPENVTSSDTIGVTAVDINAIRRALREPW